MLSYLVDSAHRQRPEELPDGFRTGTGSPANFGFSTDTIWVRVSFANARDRDRETEYNLEVSYPPLDEVVLFETTADGGFRAREATGDRRPFASREVPHRNFVFRVVPSQGPLFLRIRSESALIIPIALRSHSAFFRANRLEQMLLGMFYGGLLIMLLYNGFVYLMLRDLSYLYYVLNTGVALLYFLVWNGIAFEYFWPELPDWNNQANPFFQGLAAVLLFLFMRAFLREVLPRWIDRALLALTLPSAGVMVLALLDAYGPAVQLGTLTNVVGLVIGIPTGFYLLWRGHRHVRFLMLAWGFLLVGISLNALRAYEILPANFFTQLYSIQVGTAMELVLLSLALADRFRLMEREKEAAHQSSAAKSAFLANMSHEIRTPLHAILGMTELLEEENKGERARNYLAVLRSAGENLLHIVNDVLDISRIESGKLKLEQVEFRLEKILDETVDLILPEARAKNLDVVMFFDPALPDLILGDPVRLRQILLNLLTNAIKFTHDGEIYLEVRRDAENFRFTVRDTGIGINQEKWEEIFEAFTQADESTTRNFGGTGLGLTICRRLVDLMGGRIGVDSTPGKGSRFYFSIPLPARKSASPIPDLSGRRALLIVNPGTTRVILREYLHAARIQIREGTADDLNNSTPETMNIESPEAGTGGAFHFVFFSERPNGGDLQTLQTIVRKKNPEARTIVLCETEEFVTDAEPTRLPVPIHRAALFRLLNAAAPAGAAQEIEADLPPAPVNRPLRILLAEDNEDNRLLFLAFLKRTPHRIQIGENGQAALDLFQNEAFDLVFMDIQMPVMDGLTATRRIRAFERAELQSGRRTGRIPIYALTANVLSSEVAKCIDAGCDGHVGKPVNRAQLLEVISRHTTK